jgi:hypothetical protein
LKLIYGLICVAVLWSNAARAQSPVTLTIDTKLPGATIPADFVGLSFGMKTLPGGHFFNATNSELITLFRNLGLRHLRVGGTTVESPPSTPIPGEADIDNLFAFAKAAGVNKIIYSLRLLETNPACNYAATNAAIAKYIWAHYRESLESFAIGNEPDVKRVFKQDYAITDFRSYLAKWQRFAAAITNAVPGAKFAGPDAGSANVFWTAHFAEAEKDSGIISAITEHFYVGGRGKGVEPAQGIDDMLSAKWIDANEGLYRKVTVPVLAAGLPFEFTEANDHYSGGVRDASDTFAGALWALDFLHWWAAHDTRGVDFHNTQWVVNDVITPDADRRLTITPKGYGIKAFDLGGHGSVMPVAISNADGINLTAYAVRDGAEVFVTLINKEHGSTAREAQVTIVLEGRGQRANAIFLAAPNGDVTAKSGVTLGGSGINSSVPWQGKWAPVSLSETGKCKITVPSASAAILRFQSLTK